MSRAADENDEAPPDKAAEADASWFFTHHDHDHDHHHHDHASRSSPTLPSDASPDDAAAKGTVWGWFRSSPTEELQATAEQARPSPSQAIDDKTVASAEPADSDWSSMGAEVRLDVDSDKRDMGTDDNSADSSDNLLPQVNARFTAVRWHQPWTPHITCTHNLIFVFRQNQFL